MATHPADHSDDELFRRLRGDPTTARAAFDEIYTRYSPAVYRYALRVLGNQQLAEDLLHETFMLLHRSAARERTMTNLEAFIIRIARNLCLNVKKSAAYATVALEDIEIPARDVGYERKELERLMATALEALPDDYREALVLREYNGLSYDDIARVVGASVATVRIRIFRAKRKLRQILSPYVADLFD